MQNKGNIAIDGPAGAGKSTVARLVAEELDYLYIDTGAMYRALTWKALQQRIDLTDAKALNNLARETAITLQKKSNSKEQNVFCDGEDITFAIRSPKVSQAVSKIAQIQAVRDVLVKQQRNLARAGSVVMDGRDIGSNVLPDAPFKFFLTASLQERAQRRQKELAMSGYSISLAQLQQDISARDAMDSQREIAPLIKVPDAVEIDTSQLSPSEVAKIIVQYVQSH